MKGRDTIGFLCIAGGDTIRTARVGRRAGALFYVARVAFGYFPFWRHRIASTALLNPDGRGVPLKVYFLGVAGETGNGKRLAPDRLCCSLCFAKAWLSANPSSFVPGPTAGVSGSRALFFGGCGMSLLAMF